MIATGLFVVVVTIGITAVLNINRGHKKTQAFRTAFDNLSFIMEDISRNVRLGSNIHCTDFNTAYTQIILSIPAPTSCAGGNSAIIFTPPKKDPAAIGDLSVYAIDTNTVADSAVRLYHSIDGGATFSAVTPGDITIDPAKSGFMVLNVGQGEAGQARVTIRLAGIVTYRDITTPFDLQTTVSARLLDQ